MDRTILVEMLSSADWLQKLEKYITDDHQINQKSEEEGWTLTHYAVDVENYAAVKWLVARGADINAKDNDGCTPLHCAVFTDIDFALLGELAVEFGATKFLLSIGADPTIEDDRGNVPRDIAGHYGVETQAVYDTIRY